MSAVNLFIGQAALELGITEHTLRRLCDAGVIDVPRVGTYRVFPADRMSEFKRAITDYTSAQPVSAR